MVNEECRIWWKRLGDIMWKNTIKKQSRDIQQKRKERDERLNTTVEKLKDLVEYVESVEYADELMPFYTSEKVKDLVRQAIRAVEKEIESNKRGKIAPEK